MKKRKSSKGFGENNTNEAQNSVKSNQTSVIKHTGQTKRLIESVEVMGLPVISIHIMVCTHPKLFNRGFCQIKTTDKVITFWANQPFKQSGRLISKNRKWSTTFNLQIIDGIASSCNKNFYMKNLPQSFKGNQFEDLFFIDDIIKVKVGIDFPPKQINLQIPLKLNSVKKYDDSFTNDYLNLLYPKNTKISNNQSLLDKGLEYLSKEEGNKSENIEKAIGYFEKAVEKYSRVEQPIEWSTAKGLLASAYHQRLEGQKSNNLEKGISYLKEAMKECNREKFPQQWGIFTDFLGYLYSQRIKGDKSQNIELAISLFEEALSKINSKLYIKDWSQIQFNLGTAYLQRVQGQKSENFKKAKFYFQEALKGYSEKETPLEWAAIQENIGIIFVELTEGNRNANIETSIKHFQEALKKISHIEAPIEWARNQHNLASSYRIRIEGNQKDNLEQAIEYLENSLQQLSSDSTPIEWARTKWTLGITYVDRIYGDKIKNIETAINHLKQALEIYSLDLFSIEWANVQAALGNALLEKIIIQSLDEVNDVSIESPLFYYERALEKYTRELYPREWSAIHTNIGRYYYILSNYNSRNKNEYLEKSIEHNEISLRENLSDWYRALIYLNLAGAYKEKKYGNKPENFKIAIAYCNNALLIYTDNYLPLEWGRGQRILGDCYWKLGNYQEAIKCKESALEIYQTEINPREAMSSGQELGDVSFEIGNWITAIKGYSYALDAMETFRSYFSTDLRRKNILTGFINIYNNLIIAYLSSNNYDKALETVERFRSRYLTEIIASSDFTQADNLIYPLQDKLNEYENIQKQIDNSLLSQFSSKQVLQLDQENYRVATSFKSKTIKQLETKKQELWLQIRKLDPVLAGQIQVLPPQINNIKKILDKPSTAILSFYTIDDKDYVFVLRKDSDCISYNPSLMLVNSLQNWIAKNWVSQYVNAQKGWLDHVDIIPKLLTEIGNKLKIKEVIEKSLYGINELIIIPHLYLHLIPFGAIPLNNNETLGDRFLIRYAPSCQILEFCANRLQLTENLAYGTVEDATEDLPCASFEGEQIAQLYQIPEHLRLAGSEQATVTNYRHLMEQVQVLHSSHHAQSRLDNPLESSLNLADGYITLGQLLSPGWRMPNLSDVFLSCCETGLGVTEVTDDVLTLATGFLCAGARSVVSTLWSVDDIATSIFSIIYHRNRKQGFNRPQALQKAQFELRTMTGEALANTYRPQLEPILSEKLKYSETKRKQIKKERSQVNDDSNERKSLDVEYDKWNQLSRQISKTRKRLDSLCQEEYPFENPFYWAAFVCHGLS